MKKKSFLQGAFISSFGIILCKVLGLLYVIPFYSIIGTVGGVLYSYGYSIYSTFLNFSTLGIPTAMSKLISEYQTLNYIHTKERVYKLGRKITLIVSSLIVLLLLLFADKIAYYILDGNDGTFLVSDVAPIIRIISLALLVVPALSVIKGYIQGHKFMKEASISTVLEQVVRVVIIVIGSFVVVKVFNLSINIAVAVAMLAAFLGALSAYFYLTRKVAKNKSLFVAQTEIKEEEKKIATKQILKQIILYASPFVMIELLKTFYSVIDMVTIMGNMKKMYGINIAESTYSILTTWAPKINMIGLSIGSGVIISLIPTIAAYYIKKDYIKINEKLIQALSISMYVIIPITFLLCFLSGPVWTIFYGYDTFASQILKIYVLQIIWGSLYTLLLNLNQAMSETKTTLLILFVNFMLKLILNVPLMWGLYYLNVGGYYGSIIANIIVYTITILLILIILKKKHNFKYNDAIKNFMKILATGVLMLLFMYIVTFVIPIKFNGRIESIIFTMFYGLLGAIFYIFISYKFGLIKKIFGDDFLDNILKKIKIKKK